MSHYSRGSDGVGEGGEGGDNYVVPDHDRPENQQLHKVDDRFLKRYSIQRRKDVGNFIFACVAFLHSSDLGVSFSLCP